MTDVASKQQTTALFLSTIVTRTTRHAELTKKKTDKPDGKPVLCQNIKFSFSCSFLHSLTAQFNLGCMGPYRGGVHKYGTDADRLYELPVLLTTQTPCKSKYCGAPVEKRCCTGQAKCVCVCVRERVELMQMSLNLRTV